MQSEHSKSTLPQTICLKLVVYLMYNHHLHIKYQCQKKVYPNLYVFSSYLFFFLFLSLLCLEQRKSFLKEQTVKPNKMTPNCKKLYFESIKMKSKL